MACGRTAAAAPVLTHGDRQRDAIPLLHGVSIFIRDSKRVVLVNGDGRAFDVAEWVDVCIGHERSDCVGERVAEQGRLRHWRRVADVDSLRDLDVVDLGVRNVHPGLVSVELRELDVDAVIRCHRFGHAHRLTSCHVIIDPNRDRVCVDVRLRVS